MISSSSPFRPFESHFYLMLLHNSLEALSTGLSSPLYITGYLHGGSDPLGLANCFLVCPSKVGIPDDCQSGVCNGVLILTSMKFGHDTHLDHQHSNCFTYPTAGGGKHKPTVLTILGEKPVIWRKRFLKITFKGYCLFHSQSKP